MVIIVGIAVPRCITVFLLISGFVPDANTEKEKDKMRNFNDDLKDSDKFSDSLEIIQLYEKKFRSKIKEKEKITDRKSQKKGYDTKIIFDDGLIVTIEEKFRPDPNKFYPDLLIEIEHTNGSHRIGWLYKSNAEILAYFQRRPDDSCFNLTLWKLKEIAEWTKSNEFITLLNDRKIKEINSESEDDYGHHWKTKNYAIPFSILRTKSFNYHVNKSNFLPIEFFDRREV
jgi:hypothetical protein